QCATHARVPVAIVPESGVTDSAVRRVVVGMDGSAGACAALRWAAEFVPPGAAIRVVGVWQPASWDENSDLHAQADGFDAAQIRFGSVIDEIESTSTDVAFERHFVGGHAAEALLTAAEGTDAIVVGERGTRGLRAALLGSTATEVLHRAELTTVIVPAPHNERHEIVQT
ncbi:MAG: universal stress protein, partial [Ilumatobacter sp.]